MWKKTQAKASGKKERRTEKREGKNEAGKSRQPQNAMLASRRQFLLSTVRVSVWPLFSKNISPRRLSAMMARARDTSSWLRTDGRARKSAAKAETHMSESRSEVTITRVRGKQARSRVEASSLSMSTGKAQKKRAMASTGDNRAGREGFESPPGDDDAEFGEHGLGGAVLAADRAQFLCCKQAKM